MLSVKISCPKRQYIPIYLLKLTHSDPGDKISFRLTLGDGKLC